LNNRHFGIVAGMGARLLTPYGLLHLSAARDVLGNSRGWNGELGYACAIEFDELEIFAITGLNWANSAYNGYYYGVSKKEAQKSGLRAYKPGAGFSPYLGLTPVYSLTDVWDIVCSGKITFLNKEIKSSPMVGKHHIWSITAGIMYNF
jgi:outer membrane protein